MYLAAQKKREEEELLKKFKQEPFTCFKHGRQGNPHPRIMSMSKSGNTIHWRNPTKKIPEGELSLEELKEFKPGCDTVVFKRQNKKWIEANATKCFSVVADNRTLDLEFPTEAKRQEWEKVFSALVDIGKGLASKEKSKEDEQLEKVTGILKKWNFDVNSEDWKISKVLNKGESPNDADLELISCVWEKNPVVKTIDFSNCNVTDKGAESISKYIRSATNLQLLDLSHNKITDAGLTRIAQILDVSRLKCINLSHNAINDFAMKDVGKGLQKNLFLEELILDKNAISDDGILTILEFLQENRTLKLLSLNENKLEGKGAKALLPLMKKTGITVRIARNPMVIFQLSTIKPSSNDGTLEVNLFLAIEQGDFHSVLTLLLDGANPTVQNDTDGKCAIHIAAIKGDQAILEMLLDHPKSDINVKDDNDMTPILCAMEEGKQKIVQYLLDRGADFRIPNNKKMTLLHFAAEKGNKLLIKHLIEKLGDDLSLCTLDQETVLHFASQNQHLETIKYLIEREQMERKALLKSEQLQDQDPTAFVNWPDIRGDTALHRVFKNVKVDVECAKVLVALGGSDPSLENASHQSALATATDQVKSILLTEARKFKK